MNSGLKRKREEKEKEKGKEKEKEKKKKKSEKQKQKPESTPGPTYMVAMNTFIHDEFRSQNSSVKFDFEW